MKLKFLVLYALAVAILSSCFQSEKADLVVHNALIYSVDENMTTHEAMAIKDGVIIELGQERQILNKYKAKEVVDAKMRPVFPGFYDAHSHFLGYADNMAEANLFGTKSPEEVLERLKDFASTNNREWIVGRGWDQNDWQVQEFPTKEMLDSLFPETPVYLNRVDGHAAWVNSAAIQSIGFDAETNIPGGAILKNQKGELTGIMLDRAGEVIEEIIPPLSREIKLDLIAKAQKNCVEAGLTTVTDAGLHSRDILFIDSLQKAGVLKLGVYAMLKPNEESLQFMQTGPFVTDRLSARSVKLYADGALGSRGALLKREYSDDPGNYGLLLIEDSTFTKYAEACYQHGYQLNTHCIGDSANARILKLYADVLKEINDYRWRIEHAQIVSPEDIHYFRDFGVIPSVQPVHATSDQWWAEERLGSERIDHAYANKTLKESLGILALGTDFPVENVSPIANFYSAVFRKDQNGKPESGYRVSEALSREDALRGITIWAALSSFEEDRKGSLEEGKQADFVILDQDLMQAPEPSVLKTKVIATYILGEKVF
jgi:predicted amidohydrolase YtcJ